MTRQYLKEFATYVGFDEALKAWIYEHNNKKYAITKNGTKELTTCIHS